MSFNIFLKFSDSNISFNLTCDVNKLLIWAPILLLNCLLSLIRDDMSEIFVFNSFILALLKLTVELFNSALIS